MANKPFEAAASQLTLTTPDTCWRKYTAFTCPSCQEDLLHGATLDFSEALGDTATLCYSTRPARRDVLARLGAPYTPKTGTKRALQR